MTKLIIFLFLIAAVIEVWSYIKSDKNNKF